MSNNNDLVIPYDVFAELLNAAQVIAKSTDTVLFLLEHDPQALTQLANAINNAVAHQLVALSAQTQQELRIARPIPNFEPDPLPDEIRYALDEYYEEMDEWLMAMHEEDDE